MLEEDIWTDIDECGLVYYHYWLCNSHLCNPRLKWLYDDE
jgi:hypothetical protein